MKVLTLAYDAYKSAMEGKEFPDCFDSKKQFESWYEMETFAHTKPRLFPCRDCTKDYRLEMMNHKRCCQAGIPDVIRLMGKE